MRRFALACVLTATALFAVAIAGASTPGSDVRLTNDCHPDITTPTDCGAGYVSDYTLVTGNPYTDQTLDECTISRGRENEPAIAVDPRNTQVLLGSSNDYCGVYNRGAAAGAVGPIWLGYYRSETQGASFTSSLVPGYPDDHSPYAALSQARTASAGDPVIAWDNQGRAFFGSESSDDPAGSLKTFGDVFVARFKNSGGSTLNDGKQYYGTTVVEKGSSAPNLLGKFNDKTAIEADRTGGPCNGNVYFSWSRFTGNGGVGIYFSRSTDHGVTFSSPMKLTPSIHDVQFPDISVTGNGHVYVTFRQFDDGGKAANAVMITKSTDCGKTFSAPVLVTPFTENDAQDQSAPEALPQKQLDDPKFAGEAGSEAGSSTARDCGDFADACASGFTFFRRDTQVRSTADQLDSLREWVYIVYDATKPGTELPTGSTYHTTDPGMSGQAGTFFVRYDGANGTHTSPAVIDNEGAGHQVFPDISADGGVLHAMWWDSRFDRCYSVTRPIGNCENRTTVQSLDVFGTRSANHGGSWDPATKITDYKSNPNWEQFDNRAVPFAGDYLWVTSLGDFAYSVWTDYRNTVQGADPRETTEDEDNATADVVQCRTSQRVTDKKGNTNTVWSGDTCPHAGGIDQDIYGDLSP
ncbi:MAG: hypothetical protein QOH23_984 [Gaiellaceae bacterium]|nr:hypothetical protein [Gaiellaceae bacterium]